jgi:hypothetical protein
MRGMSGRYCTQASRGEAFPSRGRDVLGGTRQSGLLHYCKQRAGLLVLGSFIRNTQ